MKQEEIMVFIEGGIEVERMAKNPEATIELRVGDVYKGYDEQVYEIEGIINYYDSVLEKWAVIYKVTRDINQDVLDLLRQI